MLARWGLTPAQPPKVDPADDRPLCPRCNASPVARRANNPDRLNRYCADRSCYDRLYDRDRDATEKERRDKETEAHVLAEAKRYYKLMLWKVAQAVGTEVRWPGRIAHPLPRGGSLVILDGAERRQLLNGLALLDEAISNAADALDRSRLRAHKNIAKTLRAECSILDRLGKNHLLSEIPDAPRGA